jgi:hypothetical protein
MQPDSNALERAEHIIRLAACHRPHQLKAKALGYLEAFILAHEALLVHGQLTVEEIAESGCPDCRGELPSFLGSYAQIAADIGVLQSCHNAISGVDGDFQRPDQEVLAAASEELRSTAREVETFSARARLERLIQHPDASDAS